MRKTTFRWDSPAGDGVSLFTQCWEPEGTPVGVVQIVHGMVEHILRYEEFAAFLTAQGYVVVGNDHRGHGQTAGAPEKVGHLADEEGFERMVEDCHALSKRLQAQFPSLPIFIFGHSMGSFVAQRLLQRDDIAVQGVILCGSSGKNPLTALGRLWAKHELRKNGPRARSAVMNQLVFGAYNRKFRPARTDFDWLSRDESEVDRYLADPYCGAICTCAFYYDFLTGLSRLFRREALRRVSREIPLLLIAGDQDPVGAQGKGMRALYRMYRRLGVRDSQMHLYPGARHELLHETNRSEVMGDVLQWLRQHTPSGRALPEEDEAEKD